MEYTTLCKGLSMPMLGFGTYRLSESDDCSRCVEWALETGYRLIDTAEFYGNEAAIGKALRHAALPRKELFLMTKLWFTSYAPEKAEKALEESLKNLQTDYLDLVLLHWPLGDTYGAWRVLEKAVDQGLVRAIGVSNYTCDRLVDLVHFSRIKPVLNQVEANLWCQRQPERPWHEKYHVQMQAYAPIGRKRPTALFEDPRLVDIAADHGKSVRQIMLRFLLQNGIAVIPKSAHQEHIRENFQVFDFTLSDQEMALLRSLDQNLPVIGKPQDPASVEELLSR